MDHIWRQQYGYGYRRQARPVIARLHDYQNGAREIWHSHGPVYLRGLYLYRAGHRALVMAGLPGLSPLIRYCASWCN